MSIFVNVRCRIQTHKHNKYLNQTYYIIKYINLLNVVNGFLRLGKYSQVKI